MREEDIPAALQDGRIDTHTAEQLPYLFKTEGPVVEYVRNTINLSRTAIEQGVERPDPLVAFRNSVGAAERPGIVRLFEATLARSVESTSQMTIDQADAFHQINAIAREQIQPVFSSSISATWQHMGPYMERDRFAYDSFTTNLHLPTFATEAWNPLIGRISVVDFHRLQEVFGCSSSEEAMTFLRNLANAMGQTFAYHIVQNDRSPEMSRAQEFGRMRGRSVQSSIVNGFTSGAADTVNPLDILVKDALHTHGPDFFTSEMKDAMTREHVNFAVLFAKFNMLSLGAIEHAVRIPEKRGITNAMRMWLRQTPDIQGKGFPANCEYNSRYFSSSSVKKGEKVVPVADFNFDEFTPEELQAIQIGTVRFTCPSLGKPHAEFTEAMCRAYWKGVFPLVLEEYEKDRD